MCKREAWEEVQEREAWEELQHQEEEQHQEMPAVATRMLTYLLACLRDSDLGSY